MSWVNWVVGVVIGILWAICCCIICVVFTVTALLLIAADSISIAKRRIYELF